MNILVIAAHDGETLNPLTRRAVTAAKALGGEISLLIAGAPRAAADAAAAIAGVDKVLWCEENRYAHALAEPMAALIATQAEGFEIIMAVATAEAKAFLPRAAALLDLPMVSNVSAVVDSETFERPVYAGSLIATVACPGRKILSVRPISFAPAGDQPAVTVEKIPAAEDPALTRFISETDQISTGRPELSEAKIVVSGGRGVATKEGFGKIEALADVLHAGVGASRAAVDGGFAPNACQVGQSGHSVAPEIYLAVGISGAIQHMAGIRDSRIIAAINKDPDAPIFQVADIGLIGDLHSIIPELTKQLKTKA